MQKYSEYQPTQWDSKGAFLRDQGLWLVVPCGLNRDSDCLDESNFACAVNMLGGESDTVEVHRFGHWGCGWFEIIIINPESPQAATAHKLCDALAEYPILDESDWSERECNRAAEYWQSMGVRERAQWCAESRISIFAARRNEIPEDESGELISRLAA